MRSIHRSHLPVVLVATATFVACSGRVLPAAGPPDGGGSTSGASTSGGSTSGGSTSGSTTSGGSTSGSSTSGGNTSGSSTSGGNTSGSSTSGSSTSGSSTSGGTTSGSSTSGGTTSGGTTSGGTTSGSSTSGASTSGATTSGASTSGSSSSGGSSSGGTARLVPAHNGLRGQSFNEGWKFHRGDAAGAERPDYDDGAWRSLSVPHDWSIEQEFRMDSPARSLGGFLEGGVGWYRKTFTLDASLSGQRILLGFDGVFMNSEVWVNGTSLGRRPYGYSSFEYDATPHVKLGGATNVVAVRADNSSQPNSRWYTGSGIYRNVWLTTLNAVHIPNGGVFVSTPTVTSTSASVSVSTEVQNESTTAASVTVTTTLSDPGGVRVTADTTPATLVAAGTTSTLRQALTVPNPQLWSTTHPALYDAVVEVKRDGAVVDRYRVPLGIRTYRFDPAGGFSLNGQPMKLRGVCMHHDLGALGTAINRRALERQLQLMKAMGANAIRTSHNPPAPELLDLCDRQGLLVMDEAFDVWETGKDGLNDYHLYFKDWAQTDLQAMVRRDRNHPSVVLWSIGNEIQGASIGTATNLIAWVKAIDPTRPVTWACNAMWDGTNQAIAQLLDVQGYNYQEQFYDRDRASHPDWNLYGSETCSAVRSRGIYHADGQVGTDDLQCSSYDDNANWHSPAWQGYLWDERRPFVGGQFVWTGFDYLGEPTPYRDRWPARSSYFGIVDTAGFPKDTYHFYASRWTSAPMVHVLPHWSWKPGDSVRVHVYTNGDSAEVLVNGKSQGSRTFASGETEAAARLEWTVPWEPGTLRVEARKGGAVVATEEVKTAGAPAAVKLSVDRATLAADGRDLAFVTADVVDGSGVTVPTATSTLQFSVKGPGQIVGTDNGNPIDVSASLTSPTRNAFSGKALCIVRSTGAPGAVEVTATSAGLSASTLTVTAR